MLTVLAGAVAFTLLILVLRMNSNRFQADRESPGKRTRAEQLKSISNWLKSGTGTIEPVSNRSGS